MFLVMQQPCLGETVLRIALTPSAPSPYRACHQLKLNQIKIICPETQWDRTPRKERPSLTGARKLENGKGQEIDSDLNTAPHRRP